MKPASRSVSLLALGLLWSLCVATAAADFKVIQISVLFRHGARTPRHNVILDKWDFSAPGALTANGLRMLYLLGAQVRRRYPGLFSAAGEAGAYRFFSSPVPRCLQSAQSFLLGALPLGSGARVTLGADSRYLQPPLAGGAPAAPVPEEFALPRGFRPAWLEVQSLLNDKRFLAVGFEETCPGWSLFFAERVGAEDRALRGRLDAFEAELRAAGFARKGPGDGRFSLADASDVSEELDCYWSAFGRLPAGLSPALRAKADAFSGLFLSRFFGEGFQRLATDRIARDVVEAMRQAAAGGPAPRAQVFAGHATNLAPFHLALGLASEACHRQRVLAGETALPCRPLPAYAENLLFELSERAGEHFVRVLLNGQPAALCADSLREHYCRLADFVSLLQRNAYFQGPGLEALCQNPLTWDRSDPARDSFRAWAKLAGAFALLLAAALAALLRCHPQLVAWARSRQLSTRDRKTDPLLGANEG